MITASMPPMSNYTEHAIWASFLKKRWAIYLLGFFSVILAVICQTVSIRNWGWMIDFFNGKPLPDFFNNFAVDKLLTVFLLIFISSKILTVLGRVGWRLTFGRQTHVASSELKKMVWENVRFFPLVNFSTIWPKGVLMNAVTSDVGTARFIFGFTLVAAADAFASGLFSIIFLFMIHQTMTLCVLGVFLFLPFAISKLSFLEMTRYREAQESLSDFNDLSGQMVSTVRLQRVSQTGGFWGKRLFDSADGYRKIRLRAVLTSLKYYPVMGGGTIASYLVLFVLGIHYVMAGQMSIGDFVAMQGLIMMLQMPLMELGFVISDWRKGITSLARLNEIYSERKDESVVADGLDMIPVSEVLDVDHLSFKYQDGEKDVFSDISVSLKKGGRLGIIGPVGSGKSTLIKILSGIERNHKGKVLFYRKKFGVYSHKGLRSAISIVPQRPFLFADNIRANVSMGLKLSDDDVWFFLDIAGVGEDVRKFPDKLDTMLGEWGINLSGGQKQRLTLARALACRPKILFLDDCLSAVDTVTEEKILKNLDRELVDSTIVWAAHRRSTLKYCTDFLELGQ